MWRRALGLGLCLMLCAATPAELYARGAAAYDSGDYAHAVVDLAQADAIAPSAVALELALKASLKADDAAHGMELAERAEGRKVPAGVTALATQARGRFAAHAGKVHASCDCELRLDEAPMKETAWATVGRHTVSFVRNGHTDRVPVNVIAEKTAEVAPPAPERLADPPAPPPPTPTKPAESAGPSPVWFWVAAGVTVVAGVVTGLSGADTASKHEAFALDRSNTDAANAGSSAQARTNILAAVTGGAALATVAIGVFVVKW
jgi:hypothetical protein